MPRYFFDLHNDVDADDPEGRDLPDLASAVALAVLEAREMIQASVAETSRIDLSQSGGQLRHSAVWSLIRFSVQLGTMPVVDNYTLTDTRPVCADA